MTADARSPKPLETQPQETQPQETQWPRWEIFKQDTAARPLQAVGSVHAGDPEHALLTARNVFVRRPAAVSLWAVREDDLLTATPEVIATHPELLATPGEAGRYQVGIKATAKRSMTFVDLVGAVEASGPGDALGQARALHPDALAWQVFSEAAAVKSDASPETVESWFAPARDKTYKQQQFYGVIGRHVSAFKQAGKPAQAEETP